MDAKILRSAIGKKTREVSLRSVPPHVDMDNRTVELSYASEMPVERSDYRTGDYYEVLSHKKGDIDTTRMDGNAPFLHNHNPSEPQLGSVIAHKTPDKDGKSRATIKFSKSQAGQDALQDYADGIRSNISVGYDVKGADEIQKEDLEPEHQKAITRNIPILRCRWAPMELSDAPVPADTSVGAGRSASPGRRDMEIQSYIEEIESDPEKYADEFEFEEDGKHVKTDSEGKPVKKEKKQPPKEGDQMTDQEKAALIEEGRKKAALETKSRMDAIDAIEKMDVVQRNEAAKKLCRDWVKNDKPVEELKEAIMRDALKAEPVAEGASEIGMRQKDLRNYSIVRAINGYADAMRGNGKWEGFEADCHQDVVKRAAKMGYKPQGLMIPYDVMRTNPRDVYSKRDLNTLTGAAGQFGIDTEVMGQDLIQLLRNRIIFQQLGATMLTGLEGNVAIPKQTGAATFYWGQDGFQVTESDQTLGQIGLVPHTGRAMTQYTKNLLTQSSLDVEMFVRDDLSKVVALGIDSAMLNGTGADSQPLGIFNYPGLTLVQVGTTNAGGNPTWPQIVDLESAVAKSNADFGRMSYLTSAGGRSQLKQTLKGANSTVPIFLWETGGERRINGMPVGEMNGYDAWCSNQVPSNFAKGSGPATNTALLFGNFESAIIGTWGVLDVVVDPYTRADFGEIRVVYSTLVDLNVKWIQSFAATTDMVPA